MSLILITVECQVKAWSSQCRSVRPTQLSTPVTDTNLQPISAWVVKLDDEVCSLQSYESIRVTGLEKVTKGINIP